MVSSILYINVVHLRHEVRWKGGGTKGTPIEDRERRTYCYWLHYLIKRHLTLWTRYIPVLYCISIIYGFVVVVFLHVGISSFRVFDVCVYVLYCNKYPRKRGAVATDAKIAGDLQYRVLRCDVALLPYVAPSYAGLVCTLFTTTFSINNPVTYREEMRWTRTVTTITWSFAL